MKRNLGPLWKQMIAGIGILLLSGCSTPDVPTGRGLAQRTFVSGLGYGLYRESPPYFTVELITLEKATAGTNSMEWPRITLRVRNVSGRTQIVSEPRIYLWGLESYPVNGTMERQTRTVAVFCFHGEESFSLGDGEQCEVSRPVEPFDLPKPLNTTNVVANASLWLFLKEEDGRFYQWNSAFRITKDVGLFLRAR